MKNLEELKKELEFLVSFVDICDKLAANTRFHEARIITRAISDKLTKKVEEKLKEIDKELK